MKLLRELNESSNRSSKIKKVVDKRDVEVKTRNIVAMNSLDRSGRGVHVDKQGKRAPRNRQKAKWKREVDY